MNQTENSNQSQTSQSDSGEEISSIDLEALPPLKRSKNPPLMCRGLRQGYAWNPLLTFPRNKYCPCQSGKKFKACCLSTLPAAVTLATAKKYKEAMAKPALVFLTKENQEKVLGPGPTNEEELEKAVESGFMTQEDLDRIKAEALASFAPPLDDMADAAEKIISDIEAQRVTDNSDQTLDPKCGKEL